MLIGSYRHQIDQKCRFRMPSKFKEALQDGFVVAKGVGGCLYAFSKEAFNELYKKLESVPMFDVEAQKPIRALLSSAFEAEEDNQGRILIPQELRNFAKLTKNLVSIGVGNRVEIWAEEVYEQVNSADTYDLSASSLSKYGV